MQLRHGLKTLWRNLTNRQAVESDLEAEIRSYREMLEDEKLRDGLAAPVARREALLELGGTEQIKEEVRDIRLGATLETIAAEARQSLRALRRNPGLTVVATLMLALGIGSSMVVFSIFQAALLRPLPFREVDRVVELAETRLQRGINESNFSEANFWDLRQQNRCFEETAAYHYDEANLIADGPAEKVVAISVTAGFFRTLGVSPVLGRDFAYDDDRDGYQNHVALVGYRFWQKRFGGDPQILGRTLRIDGRPYTVIGVLPRGEPWIHHELYLPFGYRSNADRTSWEFNVIGRLKPGVSAEAARADLERIAAGLAQSYPKDDKGIGFKVIPSSAWVASDNTRRALWVLLGAVGFLLLIACLNIANLLLARGMSRSREVAVRTALGATRARLVRLVMTEAFLLSGFGTLLGLAIAYGALRAIQTLNTIGVPRLEYAGLNPWVLGFAALVTVATGVISGLAPALQAPADGIATVLRESDRQMGSRRQGRLRATLVTAEVALSFLLLVGAGLLIRSFGRLVNVDSGYQTENRLVFSVSMPGPYWRNGTGKKFLDRFFERLSGMPGVIAAGSVSHRPVEGGNPGMGIDSVDAPATQKAPWAGWRIVSPGYFRAVGLRLVRGRAFTESDPPIWAERGKPEPPRRVIISQSLAKLIFPNQDPVGKHALLWKGQSGGAAEVIGVVADNRERGLTEAPALTVYLPYGANALTSEFVVHTTGNPMAIAPAIRALVTSLDPSLPVSEVRSLEEVVDRSVAPQRFNTWLLAVFSGLALLLATTGIYGVLSYSMSRRTSEIGLRVALGASRRDILAMAIVQGLRPALAGMAIGAIGAAWLSRYFARMLFGIQPLDAVTYACVAGLLLLTALIACYLPGRRAMSTDPAVALRVE